MNFDLQKLYDLLPAIYRLRDSEEASDEQNGPLKAFLSVIAEQIEVLEDNLDQLYDDQFIETCAEWVVPYIGQLVGARGLHPIPGSPFSQRAEVANTIAYRRRKGTASIIEQLARDVTDWDANVVEFFQHLATTQYMNHIRRDHKSISDLRDNKALAYCASPFDTMPYSADVRHIASRSGKYNIPNIGVFLWRIKSYQLIQAAAYPMDAFRYKFDALGKDKPLYNLPETEQEITQMATPRNVPMPLRRRLVAQNPSQWYGGSLQLYVDGQEVPLEEIQICNLDDDPSTPGQWAHRPPSGKISIDPELGRIAFAVSDPPPSSVKVNYLYGCSARIGGGGYDRSDTILHTVSASGKVSKSGQASIQKVVDKVIAELTAQQQAGTLVNEAWGIVEIQDNEYYFENLRINVGKGQTLELRAADNCYPVVVMNGGECRVEGAENSKVILNGILFCGGQIHVPAVTSDALPGPNELEGLNLLHCTLLPEAAPTIDTALAEAPGVVPPRLLVELSQVQVLVENSITGPLRLVEGAAISLEDSIVDASDNTLVAYAAPDGVAAGGVLKARNCTFIGKVHCRILEMASNCIFWAEKSVGDPWLAPVMARQLQTGCARFSWFPADAKVPRRYRCLMASPNDVVIVRPMFESLRYGDAHYGMISRRCHSAIATGADDESEMGAFHQLYQPQRIANLKTRLDEYLRFGLEAGIFIAS